MIQRCAIFYTISVFLIYWGYAIGKYEIFPYHLLQGLNNKNFGMLLSNRHTEHLINKKVPLEGKSFINNAPKGYYLKIDSKFNNSDSIRLIDSDGKVIKEWTFNNEEISNDSKGGYIKDNLRTIIHGSVILPDGSAIANVVNAGAARIDKCNNILWRLKNGHHSVSKTDRNTFWIPTYEINEHSKFSEGKVQEEFINEIDIDGNIVRSFSIEDVIFNNNLQHILPFRYKYETSLDPTHINDVEELSKDIANEFPLFEPGDIIISMRTPDTILVLSPDTLKVKWYANGPWNKQHDPDFQSDGTITLFNNNSNEHMLYNGESNIMKIDPVSRKVEIIYKNGKDFFTGSRGKHEIQANNDILITSTNQGRVFQFSKMGMLHLNIITLMMKIKCHNHKSRINTKELFQRKLTCEQL